MDAPPGSDPEPSATPSASPPSRSAQLRRLRDLWTERYPRRARGGLWALSGFAFQANELLIRLFEGLEAEDGEPGEIAEMEGLSDVLHPHDGRFLIVQVKRSLDATALRGAAAELYLIVDLCRREVPDLLGALRFQIACRHRTTERQIGDLELDKVVPDGNEASWQALLTAFDSDAPIFEASDQRERLHVFLWNQGIRRPTALIERCLGRLFDSFDSPDPAAAVRSTGRGLAELYLDAERRRGWRTLGQVLNVKDVAPDPDAATATRVHVGAKPKLEHLRAGCFRETARERLDPAQLGSLLGQAIHLSIDDEAIDSEVVRWLNANYRRPSYGWLLKALRRRPKDWTRICATGDVSAKVRRDFDDPSSDVATAGPPSQAQKQAPARLGALADAFVKARQKR